MAAAGAAMAVIPDWSRLPEDLILVVMKKLDIPAELFRAGTVCSSWYAAYSTARRVRIPIKDTAPCLLYSCQADDDPSAAALYSPSTGACFRIRLPDPPLRGRALVGSAHGWLVAADDESNLHLVNPLTGTQLALPPVTGLHHAESFLDHQGNLMYNLQESLDLDTVQEGPVSYPARRLRHFLYRRVIVSCSPSMGRRCIVLLLHRPDGQLSFARLGDARWTKVACSDSLKWNIGYRDALYNDKDGLFYLLGCDCSITTLDLHGSLPPVAREIIKGSTLWDDPTKYIVLAPWGDLLEVWRVRFMEEPTTTAKSSMELPSKVVTEEFWIYKVDTDEQKLVRIMSIGDHALFLGFNSALCLSTKDFPTLRPDCAYLTDDFHEETCTHEHNWREIGIWDFKTKSYTMESLGDVQSLHPWMNWPSPIWVTPSIN
jgi:hypothetical protein